MLLALTQWLAQDVRAFNVFQYITLRAVLATLTALAISLLAGPLVIRKLTAYKIGQAVRNDGPQSHLTKAGTPTMGGALVLLSILTATLLWADLSNRFVWAVLVVTFGFGAIGWVDDYRKVVKNNPKHDDSDGDDGCAYHQAKGQRSHGARYYKNDARAEPTIWQVYVELGPDAARVRRSWSVESSTCSSATSRGRATSIGRLSVIVTNSD